MSDSTNKILVTGGTGMLGAHLIWHLLQKGFQVCAIKRTNSSLYQTDLVFESYHDSLSNYANQFEWVDGDVLDYDSLYIALKGIDKVYHCAALVSFSKKARRVHDINIRGTQNIVFACLKQNVNKLCFVSSIAALGKTYDDSPIDETVLWDKDAEHSVYAESKYLSEEVVWQAIKKGLNTVIVNPGVILGVTDDSNNSMKIFTAIKKGLPFYTNGGSGYIGVKDVCRAMIELTESSISGERYVLVSENLSNKELLFMIAKSLRRIPPIFKASSLLLYPMAFIVEMIARLFLLKPFIDTSTVRVLLSRSYYSSEKIKNTIGFEFTPIKKCVDEVCTFIKNSKKK